MAPGDSATLIRDPQRPAAAPPLPNPDLHPSLPTGLALHILALLLRRDAESRGGALVRKRRAHAGVKVDRREGGPKL